MNAELLNKINKCNILVFDFDGTLINSEPYHKQAHGKVLSKILGYEFEMTDEKFATYIGKQDDVIYDLYKTDFNVEYNKQEMINLKIDIATELLKDKNVKIFNYFFDLLKIKGDKKFYIVSNQAGKTLVEVLKAKNIYDHFDGVYSMPDLKLDKALTISNLSTLFDIKGKEVALFEDSNFYLGVAKQCGFLTVGVETQMNKGKITNADYVICGK